MHVVGAGLAGLSAASQLAARGHTVTLLDARPRAGGRVWTVRDGLADGQHVEMGGEFIDEGHARLRTLARRFDLFRLPAFPVPLRPWPISLGPLRPGI